MDVEQIKNKYNMLDILNRYNIPVKRGFCKCCFHSGDHTASMKIYDKSFYCFGCGKGGDFIKFVQLYEGVSFNQACEIISGERLTRKTREQLAVAKIRRREKEKTEQRLKKELEKVNNELSGLWHTYLISEPFSDVWTDSYNKWQLLVYKQEQLINDVGAL